jgi:hypothetical protein
MVIPRSHDPVLVYGAQGILMIGQGIHDVAFFSLDLQADRSKGMNTQGVRITSNNTKNILFEDVRVQNFSNNITFDCQYPASCTNMQVRRSQLLDAYAMDQVEVPHSQNLYADRVIGLLIEESVLDHGGWQTRGGVNRATQFNHNQYTQTLNKCVTFRGNVSLRGSATGLQARSGGTIVDNFYALNPVQLTYGSVNGGSVDAKHIPLGVSGTVRNNAFIQGTDIDPANLRNGYTEFGNIAHAIVENNVWAHHERGAAAGMGVNLRGAESGIGIHSLLFRNNVIFDVKDKLMCSGFAWGPVMVKAENGGAAIYLPDGVTKVVDADKTGLDASFGGKTIPDAGSTLEGNIMQTSLTDFLNITKPLKTGMILKNMQTASVTFVDPNRKIDPAYIENVRGTERYHYNPSLLGKAMSEWVRMGFQIK